MTLNAGSSASLVQSSLEILDRNKEKGDPEQIVAALRACLFDGRVQVLILFVPSDF